MTNLLLDAAVAYAKQGWPVFPCRTDKKPYSTNGVIDATTDIKQIKDWWKAWPRANIGMDVGGAGMMVIDLDPGHNMEELEHNVGPLPKTHLSARTPRGGAHLFYSIGNNETVAASSSKLAAHVDVRSFHSYVLLAPSRTSDGGYHWSSDAAQLPAYRTDAMVRSSNAGRTKHEDRDDWLIEPDLPENIGSATAWLKDTAQIAVEGQGGDAMAYATAAHMKSFGISAELAFDLMWEYWNPRCSPPWTADNADHLQQKVENGYAYNTSPPGNITAAYHVAKTALLFAPVETDLEVGSVWTTGRFRFIDRAGMGTIQPPEWIIDGFIPEHSYAMLFGARGTFKTFIALDIALSVAAGIGFGDRACWPEIARPGNVLFTAGEGHASIHKRVRAWEQIHLDGQQAQNFVLADPVPSVLDDPTAFIEGALAASPDGYQLIVLDTVGRAMQGVNENAQEHVSNFTKLVQRLQYELKATVLALHHTGHSDKQRARGSSVFGADVDTEIRLDREDGSYVVGMTMTKQKDAEEWRQPRYVKMLEVHTDVEHKSLVAITTTEKERPVVGGVRLAAEAALISVVEAAVLDFLEDNADESFSNTALGDAIGSAEYPEVAVKGQQITKTYLRLIRENSDSLAAKCYQANTGRWRWTEDSEN